MKQENLFKRLNMTFWNISIYIFEAKIHKNHPENHENFPGGLRPPDPKNFLLLFGTNTVF